MNNCPQTPSKNSTDAQNKSTDKDSKELSTPFSRVIHLPAKRSQYNNMMDDDVNPDSSATVKRLQSRSKHRNHPYSKVNRDPSFKRQLKLQPTVDVGLEFGHGASNPAAATSKNQVVTEPIHAQATCPTPVLSPNETRRSSRVNHASANLSSPPHDNRPQRFVPFAQNNDNVNKRTSSSNNSISNVILNATQASFAILGYGVSDARGRQTSGDVGCRDEVTSEWSSEVGLTNTASKADKVDKRMPSTSTSISVATTTALMTDERAVHEKRPRMFMESPSRHVEPLQSDASKGKMIERERPSSSLTGNWNCTEPLPETFPKMVVNGSDVIVKSDRKPGSIPKKPVRALPRLPPGEEVSRSTESAASSLARSIPGHSESTTLEPTPTTPTTSNPTHSITKELHASGSAKMGGNDKDNSGALRATRTADNKNLVADTQYVVSKELPAIYNMNATTRKMQPAMTNLPSTSSKIDVDDPMAPAFIGSNSPTPTLTTIRLPPIPPRKRTPIPPKPPRLSIGAIDRRVSFNNLLEGGSGRLSPSVIIRPPPLPLLNLPMLMTPGGSMTNTEDAKKDAKSESERSSLMSIPALPLQGSSTGTAGHEEVDDIEEGDEEDEDEEATSRPGRSSFDSEKSTEDEDDRDVADRLSLLAPSEVSRSTSRASSYETARAEISPTTSEFGHESFTRPLNRRSPKPSQEEVDPSRFDLYHPFLNSPGMSYPRSSKAQRQGYVDIKGKSKQREEDYINEDILPHTRDGTNWDSYRQSQDDGYTRGDRGAVLSNTSKVVSSMDWWNNKQPCHTAVPPVPVPGRSGNTAGTDNATEPLASRTSLSFVTSQSVPTGMGTKLVEGSKDELPCRPLPRPPLVQSWQGTATLNTTSMCVARNPRGNVSTVERTMSDNRNQMSSISGLPPRPTPVRLTTSRSSGGGAIVQHPGMYRRASKSLIDVRSIEKKEMVEKMVRDQEEEEEKRRNSRRVSKMSVRVSGVHESGSRSSWREHSDKQSVKESFMTATEEMPGEDEGGDKEFKLVPSEGGRVEDKATTVTMSAPALHPLRRRRSMPTSDPPPYSSIPLHLSSLKFRPIIQPREDEGMEKLPSYSNDIHLRAIMPRKMEFSAPGVQAKDRKWRRVLCVLEGTVFKVYKCPVGAGGVSAIGEWWESKVGASPQPSSPSVNYGSASGRRQMGARGVGSEEMGRDLEVLRRDIDLARARKDGEGGEPGQPVLRRGSLVTPVQQSVQQQKSLGHHSSNSVGGLPTTKSALTFAVQLLKPGTRHKRSNSDVPPRSPQFESPGYSLPRSATPTTASNHGMDSTRPHSPAPSSSYTVFNRSSRPSTPTFPVGSSSAQPRGPTFRVNGRSSEPSTSRQTDNPDVTQGKDRRDVLLELDENDLIQVYTMQHAESGLGKDYTKRPHVIRLRLQGQQFLLQAKNTESVIGWIEGLQAAANVALDLDERPMPTGPVLPRRRRRRRRAAVAVAEGGTSGGVSSTVNNIVVRT